MRRRSPAVSAPIVDFTVTHGDVHSEGTAVVMLQLPVRWLRAMITIRRVTKAFGATTALAGVDLEIGQGECLAIVGAHGSGRTTLLRILATLVRPTSGRVEINGIDIVAGRVSREAARGLRGSRSDRRKSAAR